MTVQYASSAELSESLFSLICLKGFPTWQINGKMYPGDQELDELEEIIKENLVDIIKADV